VIKKRRKIKEAQKKNINNLNEELAILKNSTLKHGVIANHYIIKPEYGTGYIFYFVADDVNLSISRFLLHKDFIYTLPIQENTIQISFLLAGEKIIQIDQQRELYYENKESYLVNINGFNGVNRISGKKLFKEIKINIPINFLTIHSLITHCEIKTISDSNLILPITDELHSILENLERKEISALTNSLYLKAKIFELIALQLEHYNNRSEIDLEITRDKTLKKLYAIKQTIKNNVDKNYTIKDFSGKLGVTSNTLNKEFTRVFNYSINEYGKYEKMKTAKNLLENSDKLVYQIAEETGYKNATHFTAAFKKMFNITPKEYRNKL
jgi:AraC-like DNA-binding protein